MSSISAGSGVSVRVEAVVVSSLLLVQDMARSSTVEALVLAAMSS